MDRTNEMDRRGIAVFTAENFLELISAAHEPLAFTAPVALVAAGSCSRGAFDLNKSESFSLMTAQMSFPIGLFLVRKRGDTSVASHIQQGRYRDLSPDMDCVMHLVSEYRSGEHLRDRIRTDLLLKGLLRHTNVTLAA